MTRRLRNWLITTALTLWGGYWKSSKPLKWRSHGYCSFFAYHPFSSSYSTLLSASNPNPNPSFSPPSLLLTYSVPSDIAQQVDLLSAKSIPYLSSAQQIVSLGFNHALTAIQFKTGANLPSGITIKSISFKNIPYKGIHKLGETGNNAWTVDPAHKRDFSLTLNYSSDGTTGKDITTPSQTLMMIPQRLPSDATLQVVVAKNGVEKTLSLSLNNFLWEQGKKLIYNISTKSIVYTYSLEAVTTGSANYDGTGNITYNIKSTKTDGFGQSSFVPWTMEFSTDGGSTWKAEKPDFITLTTQSNSGSISGNNYNATFTPQAKTYVGNSHDILKARTVLNDVDLAHRDIHGNTHSNGQTTANCYVIHNPGTYKFPTIYGNAMKNGQNNTSAYTSTKSGSNILSPFLGAQGPITKPQIEGINNACLIWQDTENLVSDIKFADNYVSFAVKKETIHNGNAIIAVRNSANEILWSWHIWVTEEDLTPIEITNHGGYKYNILPVNLGWCALDDVSYKEREVKVRIKQVESNKTKEITLEQAKSILSEYNKRDGNCTYYQWGRKDPMLPSDGITPNFGKNKECFTNDSQYKFAYKDHGEPLNTTDIKEYIRNPYKFNIKPEMDGQYYNLWSTDNTRTNGNDDKVIKSVYDPSPVGYTIPTSNAFTGFTTTGGNTSNPAEFNVNGGFDKGWHFYTKPNKQGQTIFFPECGYRNSIDGIEFGLFQYSFYWVATPYNWKRGFDFYYEMKKIYPLHNFNRSHGFTMRPAQEK